MKKTLDEKGTFLDRNLALEAVRVTESAALATVDLIGRRDEKKADEVAVNAMRQSLNLLSIDGTVVIGEGERDKAPMLYIGEKVGDGDGPAVDIAIDPLEGTTICANGGYNSLSVLAMSEKGGFLHAPDVYMEKLAVGIEIPNDILHLDATPTENIRNLAKFKKCKVSDICVMVLDRDRHEEIIHEIIACGAKIKLIQDGDVAGVISTTVKSSRVDMYLGIGGAPEGVLAAAALRCTGGFMQTRLIFNDSEQIERANSMGIKNINKIYGINDMANGDVMFSATGVTDGNMLKGISIIDNNTKFVTHSIVMRSKTKTTRYITTEHRIG